MSSTDLPLLFTVRAQVYDLLAGLYLNPPDEQQLHALRQPEFVADWPLGRGEAEVEQGLARLAACLPEVSVEALRREFWHLFGTLGPAAAPPWQSVYLDRERVLMGEETLRFRALMNRYDLAARPALAVTDDHIGVQLQFLAELARRTASLLEAGDEGSVAHLLEGQRECLEEHLLRWVDRFAELAEEASETGFYGGLARLTLGLLRHHARSQVCQPV